MRLRGCNYWEDSDRGDSVTISYSYVMVRREMGIFDIYCQVVRHCCRIYKCMILFMFTRLFDLDTKLFRHLLPVFSLGA